jgi:hypothetical protein
MSDDTDKMLEAFARLQRFGGRPTVILANHHDAADMLHNLGRHDLAELAATCPDGALCRFDDGEMSFQFVDMGDDE